MATKLLKPINRDTIGRSGATMIISLLPGDLISFREKGKRTRYEITIGHALQLAKRMTIDRMYQERLEIYRSKKKQGRRAIKPKRPNLFLSPIYNIKP